MNNAAQLHDRAALRAVILADERAVAGEGARRGGDIFAKDKIGDVGDRPGRRVLAESERYRRKPVFDLGRHEQSGTDDSAQCYVGWHVTHQVRAGNLVIGNNSNSDLGSTP